jgi:RNA polymerase sigma-70 factor (ECF subfamily)
MKPTEDHDSKDVPTRTGQVSELVELAREGDGNAFGKLVELHQEEIFRLVFFRTRSKIDSEDLTQDIFMSALKYLPQLKDSDKFRPWLYKIALNRVHDFHRKNRFLAYFGITEHNEETDVADVEPHLNPGALDMVIKREFWLHVKRLSKRFSRMEREVFFLRFADDLNLREIAQALGRSESAVKTHLYRAIRKFKEDPALCDFLQGE